MWSRDSFLRRQEAIEYTRIILSTILQEIFQQSFIYHKGYKPERPVRVFHAVPIIPSTSTRLVSEPVTKAIPNTSDFVCHGGSDAVSLGLNRDGGDYT